MGTKTDQVERSIREIVETEQGPNGQIPSDRELVARLGAGRTTIRLVLTKLTAEGVIRSEHGRGYRPLTPATSVAAL
jgi:GntR family transcriptional regulator